MLIRSVGSIRWGEVYKPVRSPLACKTEAIIALVEPLPLVPATWTNRCSRSGLAERPTGDAFGPAQLSPALISLPSE